MLNVFNIDRYFKKYFRALEINYLIKFLLELIILVCGSYELNKKNTKCNIPLVIRGQWYSWENGRSTTTEIDATSMSKRGNCIRSMEENQVNFTFVFQKSAGDCYTCVKFMVRTVNVLDKMESKYFRYLFEKL